MLSNVLIEVVVCAFTVASAERIVWPSSFMPLYLCSRFLFCCSNVEERAVRGMQKAYLQSTLDR